jgi:hypothetical protein
LRLFNACSHASQFMCLAKSVVIRSFTPNIQKSAHHEYDHRF